MSNLKTLNNKTTTYYTHGFHPFPAKFTPQIVERFLNLYCKFGYNILDPFCGSGTTLVEGVLNGINSVGIDLNPIATLISRVKSTAYSKKELQLTQNFIESLQLNLFNDFNLKLEKEKTNLPEFLNRTHWFQENVSYELAILKKLINNVPNLKVKDLLRCGFSKIIVKVSNQDSEVRYSAKNKNHPDGFSISLFIKTISNYLKKLNDSEYNITAESTVYSGDSYSVLKTLNENYFDLIITSPPYINTFDYYLYHKQRMLWLDYDYKPIRNQEIGNHHKIDTKTFDVAKSEYIQIMTQIISELSRVTKKNSYFVMIIGDGIIDGKVIDMSRVISEICKNSPYSIEDIESVSLSSITKSFNKKFSNAPKKEHTITLKNFK